MEGSYGGRGGDGGKGVDTGRQWWLQAVVVAGDRGGGMRGGGGQGKRGRAEQGSKQGSEKQSCKLTLALCSSQWFILTRCRHG